MSDWLTTYIEQTNEIRDLLERSDHEYGDRPDLIAALHERSARVFRLLCANNDLIREYLQPQLASEEPLSAEGYASLADAAQALCTFSNVTDACLALHIRQRLLRDAEARQDTEQIIRQCYECGIAALLLYQKFTLFSMLHVRRHVTPWFARAAAYLPQLETLSPEARGYVLRSLNNRAILFNPREYSAVDEQIRILRHTLTVFQDETVRALAPELNWDAFLHAVYNNFLMVTDTIEHGHGLEYLPDVKKAAAWLDALSEQQGLETVNDHYNLIELQNVLHLLSDEGCIQQLDALYAMRDPKEYTPDSWDRNVVAPAYSFVYEERIEHKNVRRVNQKLEQIIAYINAYHCATGSHDIRGDAIVLLRNYPHMEGAIPLRDALISIFRAVHLPTFVHSQMVAELSRIILEALLDACPEYFVGFDGITSAEEARARCTELRAFIRYAGLMHDVGKFFCMSVITQYGRRLYDDEFDIIKLHSVCGYELLQSYPSTAPYAEVALMHHITFDRKGGYAMDFVPEQESAAIITDIIHIADAMDAATDNVGRCYTQCKTLAQLMAEVQTRPESYSPVVAAVLSAPKTQEQLETALNETRMEIYRQAYAGL